MAPQKTRWTAGAAKESTGIEDEQGNDSDGIVTKLRTI